MNTLTTEAKAWIKAEAKNLKINPVGKSMDSLLLLVAGARDEATEVVLFLANGGKIEEVPGFKGIAPKKINSKETSAGGKVEAKRTPRRISKKESREEAPKGSKKGSGDLTTLHDICEELGVEGRIARRKLRNSDISKPGASWEWKAGHKDIAKVKELLK
jgi:hypothetical protein